MRRQFQLRKTIFHAYASDFRPYKKSVVSVTEYLRTQFSCLRERDAGGRRIYDFAALVSLRVRGGDARCLGGGSGRRISPRILE